MNLLSADERPIIACSTGLSSNSAIAIIRISGFDSLASVDKFFSIKSDKIKPRFAHYCSILDGEEKVDDIVLLYFKAPHSYNGENILELNVHGNLINIQKIMDLFINNSNIRMSLPGEFSFRALKNSKLSVSEVEGLELMLNASTNFTLTQGKSLLSGDLRDSYLELQNNFISHKAAIELSIDFLDDVGEEKSSEQVNSTLGNLNTSILKLYKKTQNSINGLLNPKIVIAGIPNSGKSTFFNSILGKRRAIVSEIQGTTRDYITEKIFIKNNIYELIDTAGIRETEELIEKEGIKESLKQIDDSLYSILLINPFLDSPYYNNLDFSRFDKILFSHKDQTGFNSKVSEFCSKFKILKASEINSGSIEPDELTGIYDDISSKFNSLVANEPILLERHSQIIRNLESKISIYSELVKSEGDIAIVSSELNIIGQEIQELIGIVSPDDVLHNVFNNFCIGK